MEIINEIERRLQQLSSEFNDKTYGKIVSDPLILELISTQDNFIKFAEHVQNTNKDFYEKFLEDTLGIFYFNREKRIINSILAKYEQDKDFEKLKSKILSEKENKNPFVKFVTLLPIVKLFSVEELKAMKVEIKGIISECERVLLNSNISNSFILFIEYLDIFFLIEEIYFERTEIKILENRDNIIKITKIKEEFLKEIQKENYEGKKDF